MYGRAQCKACGKRIEAEVEKDIRCRGCGRIFQIPNSPQYVIEGVSSSSPHRSIPPITSTGPNRSSRVSTLGLHTQNGSPIQNPSLRADNEWQKSLQPVSRKNKEVTARPAINIFPQRSEGSIEETGEQVMVAVEFPGHNMEQIQWRKKKGVLLVESTILSCPYRDEILLPDWTNEPQGMVLRNGILVMCFKKPNT